MTLKSPPVEKGRLVKPTRSDAPPPDSRDPAFSLQHLKRSHCITKCTTKEQAAFAKKIRILTQMTWAQIKQSHRHKNGTEILADLTPKLPSAANGEHAMVFRFSGMAPMIGFRSDNVFYVVWFDPKMKLYKH